MVMTNMFDRKSVQKTRFISSGTGPMTLSYAGRFYGKRTPLSLFKAMRMFLDTDIGLKLKIIGAGKSQKLHSLIKKYGLESSVELMPFQEPSELVNLLSSSHMLVTIDGDFPGNNIFSPSKNFDYLSITVPILGITRKGPTAALLEETGSGYWAEPDDVEGILKLLVSHQTRVREGYEFAPNHERVMDYHAKNVMKKFCNEVFTGQFIDGG
jgi:glycosyltransferase involved in cell wall biosynthesis